MARAVYGEKTVRKAERAWFLSAGKESEALIRVAFDTLGQKQRVFEPDSLSLSSMVATLIPEYFLLMSRNMSFLYNLEENRFIKRTKIRKRLYSSSQNRLLAER